MTELRLNGIGGGSIRFKQEKAVNQIFIDLDGHRLSIDRSQINWLKLFLQETEKVFDKG